MIKTRTLKEKLVFKAVRLPIPWSIRKAINNMIALNFTKKEDLNCKTKNILKEGNYITNVEDERITIDIDDILEKTKKLPMLDQWSRSGQKYSYSNIPENVNTALVEMDHELHQITDKIGEQIRNHPAVIDYFGRTPKIQNKQIWWSFSDREEREAQMWHRDIDNIFFLKCFIYLTDVNENCGPHHYSAGSHRVNRLLSFGRFTDEDLENNGFHVPEVGILGNKGSMIFEDTFGLHRGSSPVKGNERCILQYQFALVENP